MFKIKDGYKLELQAVETIKLFGSKKNLIDKTKNVEKKPSLEVAEIALVRCNLINININKCQKYFTLLLLAILMLIC